MNENTKKYLAWGIMVLAVILAGLLGGNYVIPAPPAAVIVQNQAPVIAPPVLTGAQAVEGRAVVISNTVVITDDAYTQSVNWHRGSNPYTWADIYWSIDQTLVGTAPNTTTLTLQNSYDGTTWFSYVGKADPGITDGSASLVTANAADASGSMTAEVQWPYMRLFWDVTASQPLTVTARLYLR